MARSIKKGLDYFPLDVQMEDKVKLIEAKYGIEGFGILIKLYQKIYSNGYYIKWKEENALLFSNEINVDINKLNDIINDCLCWNVFNKCLHQEYNILTSHGIQIRYSEATYRRKKVKMIKQFNLLSDDEMSKNMINVDINSINDNINSQSKVKESKVKKSKGIILVRTLKKARTRKFKKRLSPDEQPKFNKDSMPYKAAVYLRKLILENNNREPVPDETPEDLEDWAVELDRLNRLGPPGAKNKGYTWKEIGQIMEWCQDDSFWKKNIKSASKFRKQITKLEDNMKNDGSKSKNKMDQLKELYAEAKQEDQNGKSGVDVL